MEEASCKFERKRWRRSRGSREVGDTGDNCGISLCCRAVSDTGGDGDRTGRSSRGARDEAPAVAAPGGTGTADTGAQQRSLRRRPLTPALTSLRCSHQAPVQLGASQLTPFNYNFIFNQNNNSTSSSVEHVLLRCSTCSSKATVSYCPRNTPGNFSGF